MTEDQPRAAPALDPPPGAAAVVPPEARLASLAVIIAAETRALREAMPVLPLDRLLLLAGVATLLIDSAMALLGCVLAVVERATHQEAAEHREPEERT